MTIDKHNQHLFIKDRLFDCNSQSVTHIESFPNYIREIRCSWNELTELPPLPNRLESLSCNFNKLTKLPKLPKSLKDLDCRNNKLTEIPKLPRLKYFFCQNNLLKNYPKVDDWGNFDEEFIDIHNKLVKRNEIIKKLLNPSQNKFNS